MPKAKEEDPRDIWLTIEEVAERLRTTVPALYQRQHRGTGPPAIRSGSKLLFNLAALRKWEDQAEVLPGVIA